MPPSPKIDNKTLVWNAVSKQFDIADGFRGNWNKLDHNRLIVDMGIANNNAAHHRFRTFIILMAQQGGQLKLGNVDMGEAANNNEPPVRVGDKGVEQLSKNAIRAEVNVLVSDKEAAGKEFATCMKKKKEEQGYIWLTKNRNNNSESLVRHPRGPRGIRLWRSSTRGSTIENRKLTGLNPGENSTDKLLGLRTCTAVILRTGEKAMLVGADSDEDLKAWTRATVVDIEIWDQILV